MKSLLALSLTFTAILFSPGAAGQAVAVMWGDSIVAGFEANARTSTPLGTAPFGSPIPCGYRWNHNTMSFDPITELDNVQGMGADLTYGFAAAWERFRGEPLYVVSLGANGTDVNPETPGTSWHPDGNPQWLPRLRAQVTAALAAAPGHAGLPGPATLECIVFCAGNNSPTVELVQNLEAVNSDIISLATNQNPRPIQIGIMTWQLPPGPGIPDTRINRALVPVWASAAPPTETRRYVDATLIPGSTGGFADGVHLTHYGNVTLGFCAGALAQ